MVSSELEKDLSKEREPCLKRWHLWAAFGNWERSKAQDIELDSPKARIYKKCKELFGWDGNCHFSERMQIVEALYRQSLQQ
jgi:hypothetical protein